VDPGIGAQEDAVRQRHTRGRIDPEIELHVEVCVEGHVAAAGYAGEANATADIKRQRQRLVQAIRVAEFEADIAGTDHDGSVQIGVELVQLRVEIILKFAGRLDLRLTAGRADDVVERFAEIGEIGDALVDKWQGRV